MCIRDSRISRRSNQILPPRHLIGSRCLAVLTSLTVVSVSYTHLDVYKRQPQENRSHLSSALYIWLSTQQFVVIQSSVEADSL